MYKNIIFQLATIPEYKLEFVYFSKVKQISMEDILSVEANIICDTQYITAN